MRHRKDRAGVSMELVCPACRGVVAEELKAWTLEAQGELLACQNPACGRQYPLLDQVALVLPDLPAYCSEHADWFCDPRYGGPAGELLERLMGPHHPLAQVKRLSEAYREAWFDASWPNQPRDRLEVLLSELDPPGGLAADLGCATGGAATALAHRYDEVLALDANFFFLRAARDLVPAWARSIVHLVCGDALNPPVEAGVFDLVWLGNLLDSVAEPLILLGQADAMLKPGGVLALSMPFAWDPAVTPLLPPFRTGQELVALLQGGLPAMAQLDYQVLAAQDGLRWHLRRDARSYTAYQCFFLAARKRGE
jgi:SAM-dependent methyltransferase/uncharacterized protein YbaR (Trm112 family)